MSDSDTILLVEDNYKDVLLIQRALRKANVSTALEVVTHGDAAVDYLSGQGDYGDRTRYPLPVLILLDLKLPRRSGHEVLAWLRQQPGLKRIPVVVLTTSRDYADINQIYDLGVNAYLVKPISFDALVEIVQTLNLHWVIFNEKPHISPL